MNKELVTEKKKLLTRQKKVRREEEGDRGEKRKELDKLF